MTSRAIEATTRSRTARRAGVAAMLLALGGCSVFVPEKSAKTPLPPPRPAGLPPVATHTFPFDPKTVGVVGVLQVTHARHEDTLADIARRFGR